MKKVLIISFAFNQDVMGSVRIRGLSKYLDNFGWEAVILTIKSNDGSDPIFNVIETEYVDLKDVWKSKLRLNLDQGVKQQLNLKHNKHKYGGADFLLDLWTGIFAYPDEKKNWYKPAVKVGSELLENQRFDAIISSSYPFTAHLIAKELKKRYNVPWLADLRDPWSQNNYYNHFKLRRLFDKNLERKTLLKADAITTVSEPISEKLKELHQQEKIFTIPNGFDTNMKFPEVPLTKKFTITYTGNLYNGKRDPELLFKALTELKSENYLDLRDVEVNFFGREHNWLLNDIKHYNLEDTVILNGLVSREEALEKQRESQILLLLTWNNPKEKGIIPGKIFEYFSAKRPILSFGISEGCVKQLLELTNSGVHVNGLSEVKKELLNYYAEYKSKGNVSYNGDKREIEHYSHENMVRKFVNVLESILNC